MNTTAEVIASGQAQSPVKKSRSLSLRGKLLMGFASVTIIFMVAVGVTLSFVSTTKYFAGQVVDVYMPTYDAFLDLNGAIYENQAALQGFLLTNNTQLKADYEVNVSHILRLLSVIDGLEKTWKKDENVEKWHQVKLLIAELKIAEEKIINTTDKATAVSLLETQMMPVVQKITNLLNTINKGDQQANSILDLQSKQLHEGAQAIMGHLETLQLIEYVVAIFGMIASILIALFTAKVIIRHINVFREHSSRIASGDLTQYISIESDDELGQLGSDINTMTRSLASITKKITLDCHNMVSTLEEVRHTVDVQSSGASEQASSVNEITASIGEIEKSTMQTLEKAKALGEAAERTQEKGQMGLDAVEQSVQGMVAVREKVQTIAQTILDLSNQTQQVGEITAVVNNLAQQSKMLALNASIEASKAGEAGKGFSVVAVEVKNLAEQSAQSTEQVQKILEDIRRATEKAVMVTEEGTKGVDYGMGLVEQTGDIIRNLNDVIHETTIATQQIEAAIRQESAGVEQITAGMSEINQVTASFVESVKQTTEAMENLSAISNNLKIYIDTYKI